MDNARPQKYPSPCLTCTRVEDPGNCENKLCRPWRRWFLAQWALIREYPRRVKEASMPHVPLPEDPCSGCVCPRDLCETPCTVKQQWLDAKEGAMQ